MELLKSFAKAQLYTCHEQASGASNGRSLTPQSAHWRRCRPANLSGRYLFEFRLDRSRKAAPMKMLF
jgi:hypothetical protein